MSKIENRLNKHNLSPQQIRLFRHGRKRRALRLASAVVLDWVPSLAELRTALRRLAAKHQMLRMRIDASGTAWEPVSTPDGCMVLEPFPERVGAGAIQTLIDLEMTRPLRDEHAARILTLRLDPDRCLVMVALSCLHADGWSLSLFMGDFIQFLHPPQEGVQDQETVSYFEYAAWLEDIKREAEELAAYWAERERSLEIHPLPFYPIPNSGKELPSRLSQDLPSHLLAGLLPKSHGLEAFFLSLWFLLLLRHVDNRCLTLAISFDGRTHEGLIDIIGCFARFLPLTLEIDPNQSFSGVCEHVGKLLEDYRERQQCHESGNERVLPYAFQHEPVPSFATEGGASEIARYQWEEPFTLKLHSRRHSTGTLSLDLYYDRKIEPVYARQLLDQFLALLTSAVDTPSAPVVSLCCLAESERHRVLAELNHTERNDLPRIFRPIAPWSELTPDRMALVLHDPGQYFPQLSYTVLEQKANRLAHFLYGRGVRSEALVAVHLAAGLERLIALAAVLKAGAAYLVLEKAPPSRLSYELRDASVSFLLTRTEMVALLPAFELAMIDVIELDQEWDVIDGNPSRAPEISIMPSQLAYLIYTSGSTGKPKGVMVAHEGLANYLAWCREAYPMDRGDGSPLFGNLAFDATITSLWGPLNAGRKVTVLPRGVGQMEALAGLMVPPHRPGMIKVTPAHLEVLKTLAPRTGNLTPLALVMGGEALSARHLQFWHRRGIRLINEYGPTETVVGCSIFEVPPRALPAEIPIGRPIANMSLYLLDPWFRALPVGCKGELFIGGRGVSRGYWGKPAQTAPLFLPDPFGLQPGARMYRSGDLACLRPDYQFVFLGRADLQVKIRGFRVELGEIENTICRDPRVETASVLAIDDPSGSQCLVACLVSAAEAGPNETALRHFLLEQLPDYMIPSHFLFLEKMPLTRNGKVDRRVLGEQCRGEMEIGGFHRDEETLAPRNDTEWELAAIWSSYLNQKKIGIHDDFFALGGHSLNGIAIISRINEVFGVNLRLVHLFEGPRISDLARLIHLEQIHNAGPSAFTKALRQLALQTHPKPDPASLPTDALATIANLVREESTISSSIPALPRTGERVNFPLSWSQRRIWFLEQLGNQGSAYHIHAGLRFPGPMLLEVLERTLNHIVERQEVLRVSFLPDRENPRQAVRARLSVRLPVIDFEGLTEPDREWAVHRLGATQYESPFDLTAGPPWRVALARTNPHDHSLFWTLHHLISDGWSNTVLTREFRYAYEAFTKETEPHLPLLPIQYADFASWQEQMSQTGIMATQLAYWERHLQGVPVLLDLPTDRPRPAIQSFRGAVSHFQCDAATTAGLRELCRVAGTTLFTCLQATFSLLLSRYAGQDDLVLGVLVANRDRPETHHLIGFFVNTLLLRQKLGDDPSFAVMLGREHRLVADAFKHQDIPFEQIVEALQPPRNLAYNPLFQVLFDYRAREENRGNFTGPAPRPLETQQVTAKFDLSLAITDQDPRLAAFFEYKTDLFQANTMDRMGIHFNNLLRSIVANPNARLSRHALLSDTELRELLIDWNNREDANLQEKCVHEVFFTRAAQAPEQMALVEGVRHLTYGALDDIAGRAALGLRNRGVKPETVVAIHGGRSRDWIVSSLAILKAGGAYLALDPAQPRARLQQIIELAGARLVVATGKRSTWVGAETLSFTNCTLLDKSREMRSPGKVTTGNMANLIYTSGSTGVPKGVQITHRGIVRLFSGTGTMDFEKVYVFLHHASTTFDATTFEVWGSLLTGAKCVVFPNRMPTAHTLADVLQQHQVDTFCVTASMLNLLVDEAPHGLAHLKQVYTGAEVLSVRHIRTILTMFPGICVMNGYGPTESTFTSCKYALSDPADLLGDTIPIGHPIGWTKLFLYDRYLQPVPLGAKGEICIGGEGVARGYHGQITITANRFTPHPHAQNPGERLYRSGDIARFVSSKRSGRPLLTFIGRADHQVKIRGLRVEPGEIEAIFAGHPKVRHQIVVWREAPNGEHRLVAYLVLGDEATKLPQAEILRDIRVHLQQHLPDYMIPTAMMVLEEIPLTSHGKVNLKALPDPQVSGSGDIPPRTPVEEMMHAIFCEVLGHRNLGIHDNFFDQGGHSLMAMSAISRIRRALRVDLPLRDLFEDGTVAGVSKRIERLRRGSQKEVLPRLEPAPEGSETPLSYSQERLWFLYHFEGPSDTYNMPAALTFEGFLNLLALEKAWHELIRRHQCLRTTITTRAGQPLQVIHPAVKPPLVLIDVGPEDKEVSHHLAEAESRHHFHLRNGPLARFKVLRQNFEDHLLLFVLHHIVSDGWSMGILVRELSTLYGAFIKGRPSRLAELRSQYADFAFWQRKWLGGKVLADQIRFWRGQLGGLGLSEIPPDFPRPEVLSFRGARAGMALSSDVTERLIAFARRENVTLFMFLLATLKVLIGRHAAKEDVTVGVPVAGRRHEDVEGMVGFFLNTLVLRGDLRGDPPFAAFLGQVRETTLAAFEHQDVPFAKIVEELRLERDMSRNPLFQVFFNMVNLPEQRLDLPAVAIRGVPVPELGAKFDITLYAALRELVPPDSGSTKPTLHLDLHYNADLFEEQTISELLHHFEVLLTNVLEAPSARISTLPLLTGEEQISLLKRTPFTGPKPAFAGFDRSALGGSVPDRFAWIVRRYANRPAVFLDDQVWTYADVDRLSNSLARHILSHTGQDPERVALLLSHHGRIAPAIFAVLKAGKTYVPIDPSYPRGRLSYILEDSRAGMILADETHLGLARQMAGAHIPVVAFSADGESAAPKVNIHPGEFAYILYTSGSTGKPKGVIQNHRNLMFHIRNYANQLHISPEDRLSMLAAYSFDAAVMDLYGALLNGAGLGLYSIQERGPTGLAAWVASLGITLFHATPTVFRHFAGHLPSGTVLKSVRGVVLGGEEALPEDWDLFRRHFPADCWFVNGLGPTESTLLLQFITSGHYQPWNGKIPVGYPMPETEVMLLNDDNQKVGLLASGEIVIRSRYLALGYWRKPELTLTRFRQDPADPASRIYLTGDLGRRLADGSIVFMGRKDRQVKIRGHRIEPGEIERCLREHPQVQATIVTTWEPEPSHPALVAYVVPRSKTGPSAKDLRRFAGKTLPFFMIPETIVFVESFSRNAHGKLDHQALPSPRQAPSLPKVKFVSPSTQLEQQIADIWAEVLGVNRVGRGDDFFDLGGHSLLAIQVLTRIQEITGTTLPLRILFEDSALSQFAATVEKRIGDHRIPLVPPIKPVPRNQPLPLSFAQQRMWFLHQMDGGKGVYHLTEALNYRGHLDSRALERAFQTLFTRHEALRTRFTAIEDQACQVIETTLSFHLPLLDLTGLAPRDFTNSSKALTVLAADLPFDLERAPLLRAALLKRDGLSHTLLITMHHIVSDGWSMVLMTRELSALYTAIALGKPHVLPQLAIQYADYAAWQHAWFGTEDFKEHLNHWKSRLRGAPPLLELPSDRPRPPVQSFRGGLFNFHMDYQRLADLKQLAGRNRATLFMTLLTGFGVLLNRYSRQDDLVVGSPTANRTRKQWEPLIGLFANTLALRLNLAGNPPGRALLARVRETVLHAQSYQDLPFEKLVEEIRPDRSLAYSPIFQIMFALQNVPQTTELAAGFTSRAPTRTVSRFDLTLVVAEAGDGLHAAFEYNSDLFDRHRIQRMASHYRAILKSLAEFESRRISELPYLNAAEAWMLLREWNDTRLPFPAFRDMARLVGDQAGHSPDAIAVLGQNHSGTEMTLTYGTLNRAADCIAGHLRQGGREKVVALLCSRSPETVAALIGILRSGATYLPIDPETPPSRQAFLLGDAGAAWLLTANPDLVSTIPGPIPTLTLTRALFDDPKPSRNWKARPISPGQAAYIIYTSGSSGRPKGVIISHGAITNRLLWAKNAFPMERRHRFLQLANWIFDISVWEAIAPLITGATLVLPPKGATADISRLIDHILTRWITDTHFVPSLFQAFLEALGPDRPHSLKRVFCGGERLRESLLNQFSEILRGLELHHFYGPTEAAINVTSWSWPGDAWQGGVVLGRPIANLTCLVTDPHLSPVPLGVAGEFCLGGPGLARGYLNRPALTAQAFVPDALVGEPGQRLYRSGDLVRLEADGPARFLGRIDQQIKLRGFRVEPGEIEGVLNEHRQVGQAAVVVGAFEEEIRLTAFVAPRKQELDLSDLQAHLAKFLPAYMRPQLFLLDRLPQTPTGKIDRTALSKKACALSIADGNSDSSHQGAAESPTREILAGIWAELLGVKSIQPHHNFFDLGGHSLLATRVATRARQAFGIDLPLQTLFAAPILNDLAQAIDKVRGEKSTNPIPPLTPRMKENKVPLSYAQQRLWLAARMAADFRAYHLRQSVRGSGPVDRFSLEKAIGAIVKRHDILRTAFPQSRNKPRQKIKSFMGWRLTVVDLSAAKDAATSLAQAHGDLPFHLERGPLLRTTLLTMNHDEHLLLLCMHHIIADGWSMGVFIRELEIGYQAQTEEIPPPLPPLPIQYADYTLWQREWMAGAPMQNLRGYWQKQLAGAPLVQKLPLGFPRGRHGSHEARVRSFTWPESLGQALLALARRENASLFMVLLAGFKTLLACLTGERDLVVGTDVANRTRRECEDMIGFFINQLVLRTRLEGNPSFREILAHVRETALAAYDHQDLPFDKLVEIMAPERTPDISPLFQIKFVLHNLAEASLDMPGVTLTPIPLKTETAKLDFQINMWESRGMVGGALSYKVALFGSASIDRIIRYLEAILEEAAGNVDQNLLGFQKRLEKDDHDLKNRQAEKAREKGLKAFKNPAKPSF